MKFWQTIKLYNKLLRRLANDLITQNFFSFPSKSTTNWQFTYAIDLTQEIKPSETFDNKLYNLQIACKKINQYVIMPNEIFSFWQAVGNPKGQFKKSRTIRNGKVTEETGGGLCQASGIIYLISLLAGLQVTERYNHSIDLYTDENRFTPLGTDATVVYGYKDLRIRNSYTFPIKFELTILNNTLQASLQSNELIQEHVLQFRIQRLTNEKTVEILNAVNEVLSVSVYKNASSS